MKIIVVDRISNSFTKREYTDEGFLKVPARVARCGTQEYLASELGLTGDVNRIVKVFRPSEEVFSKESLDTFAGADITVEHPDGMVDSETYRTVSVGTTLGSGSKDGDFVKCDLIIKDKEGIKAAEQGKVQVSVGYSAVYDDKVPADADYEFIQRDIRVNHIALVDRARAGNQARLFDNQPRINKMKGLITLDSGKTVEIEDNSSAQLVNNHIEQLNKRVSDAEAAVITSKDSQEVLKAQLDTAKTDLEESKKLSSDEAINGKVDSLLVVKDQAIKIAGEGFTCDSTNELEIKRAALAHKQPNKDWTDKTDAYIVASFDIANEKEEEDEDDEEEGEKKGKLKVVAKEKAKQNDSQRKLAEDAAKQKTNQLGDARIKHTDSMTESWKKTVGDK